MCWIFSQGGRREAARSGAVLKSKAETVAVDFRQKQLLRFAKYFMTSVDPHPRQIYCETGLPATDPPVNKMKQAVTYSICNRFRKTWISSVS
jgi:hypothetical protein